ncbi:MAG: DUF4271 domain-containing protein [Bacteroidia bacterium]
MQDSLAIPLIIDSVNNDSALVSSDYNSFAALTDSLQNKTDTTITAFPFTPPPVIVDTLFQSHSLQFNRFYPQTIDKKTHDWFTVILIFIVIAVTSLKVFYSRILFQIFKAFVNNNAANQIVRDENILVQRASVLLSVICYAVLALFAFYVSEHYHYENDLIGSGFARFLFISLFIAFAYSLKMISLKIFGFIFNCEKPVAAYIFNLFLINNVLGMALLPLLIILAYFDFPYSNYLLMSAIAIVALFYLYRLIKGVVIWTGITHYNMLYLFLYICALEIAPLLIIIKVILI